MKSHAKRQRNNFVRGLRAETAIRSYTTALGYLQTRHHDTAVKMLEERIAFYRSELKACSEKRHELQPDTGEHLAPNGKPIDGYPRQQA